MNALILTLSSFCVLARNQKQHPLNDSYLQVNQLGGLGGLGPKPDSEELMRSAAQSTFKLFDENLIIQNQQLMDALYGETNTHKETMEYLVGNTTEKVDKYAFKIDYKFKKWSNDLNDHMYTTKSVSLIILQDELARRKQDLRVAYGRYYKLQNQIPPQEEECSQFITCSDCLQQDSCGWCTMSEKCVVGDEDGPLLAPCTNYNYNFCTGKRCAKFDQCNTCLSDPDCGWCENDEFSVCLEQQADFAGCADGWYHIEAPTFRCPKRTEAQQEDLEIETGTLWKRPAKREADDNKICKSKEAKKAIKQIKQKQTTVSTEVTMEDQVTDVRYREYEQLQRTIRSLTDQVTSLEDKVRDIKQWIKEYQEANDIEPEPEEDDSANATSSAPAPAADSATEAAPNFIFVDLDHPKIDIIEEEEQDYYEELNQDEEPNQVEEKNQDEEIDEEVMDQLEEEIEDPEEMIIEEEDIIIDDSDMDYDYFHY